MVSSGATMPARAPHSMVRLQSVIRPSMERPRTVEPRYSTEWPAPAATPSRAMMPSATSLATTPGGSSPSMFTAMSLVRCWSSVCVASTCSTSELPMPKASVPKAPWVEV